MKVHDCKRFNYISIPKLLTVSTLKKTRFFLSTWGNQNKKPVKCEDKTLPCGRLLAVIEAERINQIVRHLLHLVIGKHLKSQHYFQSQHPVVRQSRQSVCTCCIDSEWNWISLKSWSSSSSSLVNL